MVEKWNFLLGWPVFRDYVSFSEFNHTFLRIRPYCCPHWEESAPQHRWQVLRYCLETSFNLSEHIDLEGWYKPNYIYILHLMYCGVYRTKSWKHLIHNKNQNNFPSQLPMCVFFSKNKRGRFPTGFFCLPPFPEKNETSFLPRQGPNCDSQGFSRIQHHLPHRWVFGRCSDMGRTPTQQGDLHMELRHLDG